MLFRSYVEKEPIIVDGNTYDAFSPKELERHIQRLKGEHGGLSGDGIFVPLGRPRLMERMKTVSLTQETRENLLLIGRSDEQACTAAVVTSAMKAFILQGRKVRVWAYAKNRVYQAYRSDPWGARGFSSVQYTEGMEAVCDDIRALKAAIKNKTVSNELIVLLGMDRICSDFDFVDGDSALDAAAVAAVAEAQAAREREAVRSGAVAVGAFEQAMDAWKKKKFKATGAMKAAARAEGCAPEEVQAAYVEALRAFNRDHPAPDKESFVQPMSAERAEEKGAADMATGAYNAMSDFQYIVKQGSRLGYHFMLCLDSLADIKSTGLKADLFRHRLAFQLSADDSRELFGSRVAHVLPEHICQYSDTLEGYSFRPYIHRGITWDGWEIDAEGRPCNPFLADE